MTIDKFLRTLKPNQKIVLETADSKYLMTLERDNANTLYADIAFLQFGNYYQLDRFGANTKNNFIARCKKFATFDWIEFKDRDQLKAEIAALKGGEQNAKHSN